MDLNEARQDLAGITEKCNQILTMAEPHIQFARQCIEYVEDAIARLNALADQVGVNVGPLAELRDRLHRLLQ